MARGSGAQWPRGGGKMGALIRKHCWSASPIGSSDDWDQSLKTAIELMLESPLIGSVVAGPDRLFFYNDAAAALYGDRHPGALGHPLVSSFPESRDVMPHYDRAFAGETVTIEGQALDVAGQGRGEIFDANLIPVRSEAGDVIAVSMSGIEIGERARIQERLRDSEARYRAFVTASADVVYRMSADWSEMRELDGRGFLADTREARSDWMDRYILPQEHERVRQAVDRAIRNKSMFELEHAVVRADRSPGWTYSRAVPIIDDRGQITEWLGAASDITLMHESRERYRSLFEAIDEGFCIVQVIFDGERPVDYRFVEVNPAFEKQTGLHDAGRKRMRALRPEHEQFWFDTYGRIARTRIAERFTHEAAALGRWYDVYAFQIGAPEDHQVAILFNDITERRRAELVLREIGERRAFLLRLSDALRPLADAGEIQATTTRLLAEQLGVNRAMFAEVEGVPGSEAGTIRAQYLKPSEIGAPAVEPFPEHFTFKPYGEDTMPGRYSGKGLVVADVDADPEFDTFERAAWANASVKAAIVAPLVKGGRLVAEFGGHFVEPRAWTDAEVALVRDVAERTWAAAERARAEERLRESEDNYRTLFESIDEGFAEVDLITDGDGRVVDWRYVRLNPAFTRLTGMADVTGRLISEILPDLEPAWAERYTQMSKSGESVRFEEFAGSLGLWFEVYASLVGGADSRRAVVVYNNITERRRAEAALRDSEERQRLMVELVPALLWSASSDGQHVSLNERWLAYTGQSEASTQNYGWLNAIHPDDLPETRASFEHAFATGEPLERQHRIRRANDGYRWHLVRHVPLRDSQGAIIRWFGAAVDIHEGKLAEQALQESEERQAFLLELSDALRPLYDPIALKAKAASLLGRHLGADFCCYFDVDHSRREFIVDGVFHRKELPSVAGCYPFESWPLIGKIYARTQPIVVPDVRDFTELSLEERAAAEERNIRSFVVAPLVKEGELVAGLNIAHAEPRQWSNKDVLLVEDVAERTWLAVERARAEKALRASEEHQKTLLAELQHRVRNTIGIIRSIARRTGKTSDNIEEMSQLLDGRLAAFARVQAAVTRDPTAGVDLRALIDDEVQAVDVPDGHAVTIAGPEVRLTPRAAESVSLAIHELVTNAVKHGAMAIKGGKIDVHWSVEPRDGRDWLTLEWIESGLATRPKPRREGFGHELLRRKLPYDTGGTTQIDIRPDGLCFSITMPLSSPKSDAG